MTADPRALVERLREHKGVLADRQLLLDAATALEDVLRERDEGERVFQAVVYAYEGKNVPEDLEDHGFVRRGRKHFAERDAALALAEKADEGNYKASTAFDQMYRELGAERLRREKAEDAAEALLDEVARLTAAIRWALGETGSFKVREDGQGPYWWRHELRARAALSPAATGEEKS